MVDEYISSFFPIYGKKIVDLRLSIEHHETDYNSHVIQFLRQVVDLLELRLKDMQRLHQDALKVYSTTHKSFYRRLHIQQSRPLRALSVGRVVTFRPPGEDSESPSASSASASTSGPRSPSPTRPPLVSAAVESPPSVRIDELGSLRQRGRGAVSATLPRDFSSAFRRAQSDSPLRSSPALTLTSSPAPPRLASPGPRSSPLAVHARSVSGGGSGSGLTSAHDDDEDDADPAGDLAGRAAQQARQSLLQENELLRHELNAKFDQSLEVETTARDISQMYQFFQFKVEEQSTDIERINDMAIQSTENVKDGAREIDKAAERKSMRRFLTYFLLISGFLLLFMNQWHS